MLLLPPGAEALDESATEETEPETPGYPPPVEELNLYLRSMPKSYRETFDRSETAAHAAIVKRRGAAATRVEFCRELSDGISIVCVVADDCPGLLSRISATFVAHDIDVVTAQAYCRKRADAQLEAVDFFWVRRLATKTQATGAIRPEDVASIGEMLDALVRGRANFDRAAQLARAHRAAGDAVRVRFEIDEQERHTILTIEGRDRPGLLYAITEALYRERVQIVRSEVSTQNGRVLDRFHVTELDGACVHRARMLGLQTTVLAAIGESLHAGRAKRPAQNDE
jgi:[protein-PII] uridylyltransferase